MYETFYDITCPTFSLVAACLNHLTIPTRMPVNSRGNEMLTSQYAFLYPALYVTVSNNSTWYLLAFWYGFPLQDNLGLQFDTISHACQYHSEMLSFMRSCANCHCLLPLASTVQFPGKLNDTKVSSIFFIWQISIIIIIIIILYFRHESIHSYRQNTVNLNGKYNRNIVCNIEEKNE